MECTHARKQRLARTLKISEYDKTITWLGEHAKKCEERYFPLADENIDHIYKVSTLCTDDSPISR